MKYNNGDMDDLFRRASERYPLRTDSADWERLANALDGGPASPSDEGEKRRRRGAFWWFLLIPLAGIGYWMGQMGMHRSLNKTVAMKTEAVSGAVSTGGASAGNVTSAGGAPEGNPTATGTVSAEKTVKNGENGSRVAGGEKVRKMRTSAGKTANPGTVQNSDGAGGQEVVEPSIVDKGVPEGGQVRNLRTRGSAGAKARQSGLVGSAGKSPDDGTTGTSSVDRSTGSAVMGSNVSGVGKESVDQDPLPARLDSRRAPIGERNGVNVNVVAPKVPGDSQKPGSSPKHLGSHGYIGVFGAPDFSTVRFQAMKGVGTTVGVILGYSFNNRWAIETGLSMDRKRYYTAGEYFKKEMPAGYTLKDVDGTCHMLEIPLNVRYNFSTGPRMKWFATAGLSTYLMSRENYNYQVEYNWVTEDSMWNIHKPSQYWFSIVNLSAGFEQRVGKIGSLRLEPYVRIPLSGIGTGKLPIVSGGLNIGLVRDLW
jgi:Outer membrane protein beta-barrel domain